MFYGDSCILVVFLPCLPSFRDEPSRVYVLRPRFETKLIRVASSDLSIRFCYAVGNLDLVSSRHGFAVTANATIELRTPVNMPDVFVAMATGARHRFLGQAERTIASQSKMDRATGGIPCLKLGHTKLKFPVESLKQREYDLGP